MYTGIIIKITGAAAATASLPQPYSSQGYRPCGVRRMWRAALRVAQRPIMPEISAISSVSGGDRLMVAVLGGT